ncbi:hypothetical protein, partial [Nocardia alni]|uniref:hypothetical protein n=1 Tax=Nocardia alni TaxID=2815723 RepID=UPI001C23F710
MRWLGSRIALVVAMALVVAGCTAGRAEQPLRFEVSEGGNLNYFLRDGGTAAHLVLRAGPNPRLVVAFPAGNSGV